MVTEQKMYKINNNNLYSKEDNNICSDYVLLIITYTIAESGTGTDRKG